MSESFAAFVDALAAPSRAPAGISAAAASATMGLALMERALGQPVEEQEPGEAKRAIELIGALRGRMLELVRTDVEANARLEAALADTSEEADFIQAGARVPAYRSARRLVDLSIQGLTLLQPALDVGNRAVLADLELGWRFLALALEAGIVACEQHLRGLSVFFAESEKPALDEQARQGREWAQEAQRNLAWRLGRE